MKVGSDPGPVRVPRGEAGVAEPREQRVERLVLLDQAHVPRGAERGQFGAGDVGGDELASLGGG